MNERDILAQREFAERKGLEQGRQEAKLSIARKLFEAGTPVDVIVNCTGIDDKTLASLVQHS